MKPLYSCSKFEVLITLILNNTYDVIDFDLMLESHTNTKLKTALLAALSFLLMCLFYFVVVIA